MHQDEGNYAGKHPAETELNEKAAKAVQDRVRNERITCLAAHEAAAEAGVSPAVIGQTLDLLEVRINGCQLGLFGHGGKDHGKAEFKLPENAETLITAVKKAAGPDGISCYELWKAAETAGCSKQDAAAVCETADIKIKDCQLGAF
ncbi:MAG: hypothetical protein PQJ61_03150 [Spirochaetales bacterium]|uniref:Uncharacterized protein n=1 Tax=Candidatus Thalassospirochaeta sargassi TaxID=3119039 RepID=A0AAJ1IAM1_9SPIO|nr:hypothetical protein [Spirochaetales bacterium]